MKRSLETLQKKREQIENTVETVTSDVTSNENRPKRKSSSTLLPKSVYSVKRINGQKLKPEKLCVCALMTVLKYRSS